MQDFLALYGKAATTSAGLFWMAFWAFGLGYLISAMIQVFVTRERMKRSMGEAGPKSVALGTFFGFISSSCSFAALSTTRALFTKGAGLVPSLAFLLASTNLVIELGIIIAVFLSWQFVVGEYLGGLILILLVWLLVRATRPKRMEEQARKHARAASGEEEQEHHDIPKWTKLIRTRQGWAQVAKHYIMEWKMVWKDVTVGFTVAGIIAAFVPRKFFQTLFVGASSPDPSFGEIFLQTVVGPVAAFFTFIGSMGNIPLAAVLFGNGVAFAGIMAFIFSDLVVFPVLRIQAKYYGWKMAMYILGIFLIALITTSLILHYGFAAFGLLPDASAAQSVTERNFFSLDYTFALNSLFVLLTVGFCIQVFGTEIIRTMKNAKGKKSGQEKTHSKTSHKQLSEKILLWLAAASFLWLGGGVLAAAFI